MTETLSSQVHKRKHCHINLDLIQMHIWFQWLINFYQVQTFKKYLIINDQRRFYMAFDVCHIFFATVEDVDKLNWTRIFDLVKWLCINILEIYLNLNNCIQVVKMLRNINDGNKEKQIKWSFLQIINVIIKTSRIISVLSFVWHELQNETWGKYPRIRLGIVILEESNNNICQKHVARMIEECFIVCIKQTYILGLL